MIGKELIRTIRERFALQWDGIHGAPHWERVRDNEVRLAESTGAKIEVIEIFAWLHDSRRRNDSRDPMLLEWAYERSRR